MGDKDRLLFPWRCEGRFSRIFPSAAQSARRQCLSLFIFLLPFAAIVCFLVSRISDCGSVLDKDGLVFGKLSFPRLFSQIWCYAAGFSLLQHRPVQTGFFLSFLLLKAALWFSFTFSSSSGWSWLKMGTTRVFRFYMFRTPDWYQSDSRP